MFYHVYVLLSKKDGGIYIGSTDNLNRRYKEHRSGHVAATKNRLPVELVYFEGYKNKRSAILRERYLKTGWGRNYVAKVLENL